MTTSTKELRHFRYDDAGNIIGPGSLLFERKDQVAPGVVALDIHLLDRLYELGVAHGVLSQMPAERHRQSERERIRAAQEALVEDLGLDPNLVKR